MARLAQENGESKIVAGSCRLDGMGSKGQTEDILRLANELGTESRTLCVEGMASRWNDT